MWGRVLSSLRHFNSVSLKWKSLKMDCSAGSVAEDITMQEHGHAQVRTVHFGPVYTMRPAEFKQWNNAELTHHHSSTPTRTQIHTFRHTHTQTHMNTDCWEILFSCVSTAPVVWRWLYPLLESCGVCVDRSETSEDVRSPGHKKEANINNNINEILIKGETLVYTRAWHTVQKNKKHHLG